MMTSIVIVLESVTIRRGHKVMKRCRMSNTIPCTSHGSLLVVNLPSINDFLDSKLAL